MTLEKTRRIENTCYWSCSGYADRATAATLADRTIKFCYCLFLTFSKNYHVVQYGKCGRGGGVGGGDEAFLVFFASLRT